MQIEVGGKAKLAIHVSEKKIDFKIKTIARDKENTI